MRLGDGWCVRAMVAIAAYGRAEDFTVFDRTVSLADRLDALPPLPESHCSHAVEPMRTCH